MLMLLEEYYIGNSGILYWGDKSDRVILYSPKTYEELVKEHTDFYRFIELLTDKEAHLTLTQINVYKSCQL
jgi:hypothetical protein